MKHRFTITVDSRLYKRMKEVAIVERRTISALCDVIFSDFMRKYIPKIDTEKMKDSVLHYTPKAGKVVKRLFKEQTGADLNVTIEKEVQKRCKDVFARHALKKAIK